MNYELIFGTVNLAIFLPALYFSYRVVQNISKSEEMASAMFFLSEEKSGKTFRYSSILVAMVLGGEFFLFISHFYDDILLIIGYALLTTGSLGVLYFLKKVEEVTRAPIED